MPNRGSCLFGGAFDPPHLGHRRLAEAALARLPVRRLLVLPAGDHPHKGAAALAPARHRLAMCRLAFAGLDRCEVHDFDVRRTGPAWSVGTATAFRAEEEAGAPLFWLIGADNLRAIPTWRDHHRLLALVRLVTYPRTGCAVTAEELAGLDFTAAERAAILADRLDAKPVEVSSTAVRDRLRRGGPCPDLDPAVLAYVRAHDLYLEDSA